MVGIREIIEAGEGEAMLAPITTTALPVALRLAGTGMAAAAARGGIAGGLLGGVTRGSIIGGLLGAIGATVIDDLVTQLVDMFGDEGEAQKTLAILSSIEDAMGTGAILVPEPPRGYEGTVYTQRLNYFHANMNDGKMWLSDFSNGRNSWGRR